MVAALEIHVSVEARQIKYVIFWKAPSIGVVYLVPETGNLALAEPGAMWEAETWSIGICYKCVKTWLVYFWIAPSIGVVCLVAQTGKRVLLEPGAM